MIQLDGVSVPTVDRAYLSFDPFDHQASMEDLFRSESSFFAINASPTGSGKTYSWLKPALDRSIDTIAVYPTNALIADQVRTGNALIKEHYEPGEVGVIEATGSTIARWRSEADTSIDKGEALRRKVDESLTTNRSTILFTNPDYLTIVRKQLFRHRAIRNHFDRFGMIVFDEFHLADVKQRNSLLFLVDEMYELPPAQSNTTRFCFLSATPDNEENAGRSLVTSLRDSVQVEPHLITADARPSDGVGSDGWVDVMPAVDLRLRDAPTFKTGETLLEAESFDEFVEFCEGGKTVVMLDGVHEVDLVYEALQEQVPINVERITGFDRGDVDEKISGFDVLISNSAVEVGLDFQPDRIVFSAHNAASLVQRLGRLRAKEDSRKPHQAWCYVPQSVKSRIENELSPDTPRRVSRDVFEETVGRAYASECDLTSFTWRWADIEAYHHVQQRATDSPSDSDQILDRGLNRIERHFYEPFGRTLDKESLRRLHDWTDFDLLDELQSYRGSGLQVMIRDHVSDTMKLYNMFHLLRYGDVEFRPRRSFRESLTGAQRDFYENKAPYAVGFCEYFGDVETEGKYPGRDVRLTDERGALHSMKQDSERAREPGVVDGISVRVDPDGAPAIPGIVHLKNKMIEAERLCYVLPGKRRQNKLVYDLDDFFFLYTLDDASVALGIDALYLHCIVQDHLNSKGNDWGW